MRTASFALLLLLPFATLHACSDDALLLDTWSPVTTARPDNGKSFKAMTISQETRVTAVVGGNHAMGLIVDDVHVCFDGQVGGSSAMMNGTTKVYNFLQGAAHFLVTDQATIDNNADMINAREFLFIGEDGTQILEFEPGFAADQTGFVEGIDPASQPDWTHLGLSTLRVQQATLITHHTRSLPTIHKRSAAGNHTHHGLLIFDRATWQVRSEAQEYEGGLNYSGDWTLDAAVDIRIFGEYSDDAKILVGNSGDTGHTVTKTGAGTFIIDIPQGYSPQSALVIDTGLVDMHTDPGDPGQAFYDVGANWPLQNPGQHLAVTIGSAGSLRLRAASGLAGLDCAGRVEVDTGLHVSGALTCAASADCQLALAAAPIHVDSSATLDGHLRLTGSTNADQLVLIEAALGIDGGFASADLPPGYRLVTQSDALILERIGARRIELGVIDPAASVLTTRLVATQDDTTVYDAEGQTHHVTGLIEQKSTRLRASTIPSGNQ